MVRLSEKAVHHVVRQQIASGVDVINDGEQPRVGFQTYVPQRMKGFGGESKRPRSRDFTDFPIFGEFMLQRIPRRSKVTNAPQAVADVVYEDLGPAKDEIRLFKAALKDLASPPAETFMTAAAPGIIATTMLNAHYDTHEAYVFALAREMRKEYELIARDFILQIDSPDLALERTVLFQDKTNAEFVAIAEMHVAALNEALSGIPRERVRLHCCWGNNEGPHTHDIPLAEVFPVLCQAKVGALVDRVRQPAPPARVRRAQEGEAAARVHPDPRRDRHHDQLRRAPARWWPTGSARRSMPWAIAAASSRRAIAVSARSRATSWSPRTWCGPSSRLPRRRRHRHAAPVGAIAPPRRRPPSAGRPAWPGWRDRSARPCRSGRATGCWPGR